MDQINAINKVGIYIRVSSEEQVKEGYSISAQKRRLKSFCIAQDWNIANFYIDEGISAKNMERPDLKRMIKDIEVGKVDCVLVYRLDRLTRSVGDLYKLLEILDRHDCKFKSATEVYDTTTAMGKMFITIVAALAQWERENMGERLSFGYAEKVRQGKYALNFRPFGYNLDLKKSKLSIKEDEAKVVRMIYRLYLSGYSGSGICKYLNNKNITTRDGNMWNDKPLMEILKNPLYIGAIRWNGEVQEDTHDPIISKEDFVDVQKTIATRRGKPPRRVSSRYIFSGKIKCPNCGISMVGYYTTAKLVSGEIKMYMQYRCPERKNGKCKGSRTVSERNLENAFLDYISGYDYSDFFDGAVATGEELMNEKEETTDRLTLENELEKIERRKKKWQYAWSDDAISYADFKIRMDEATKEEEYIKEQLLTVETEEESYEFNQEEIKEVLKAIKSNWQHLEDLEKKTLVNSIIEQIHFVYSGSKLLIEGIDFC